MDVCEGWYEIIIITRKKRRVLTAHRQEIYFYFIVGLVPLIIIEKFNLIIIQY